MNDMGLARIGQRLRSAFAEKEIFFRSRGRMRFVRLTSRMQIGAACVCLGLLCAAAFNLMTMVWNQVAVAQERANIDARARTVAAEASKVNAYKQSVGEIAADLDRRQDALDSMVQSQFGSATAP